MTSTPQRLLLFILAAILAVTALPSLALAWPTDSQWIGVYKNSAPLQDPNSDTNGSRNIVSDATHWAAMVYFDGTYFYCRMRMDDDPTGQGGQGYLKPYGWGVEFDTNQDANDYEWLTMLNGISQTEDIGLYQNTVQGTLGDPSDVPEVTFASEPLAGNYQIYTADTSFNNGQDYWIAWRFTYATLKNALGLSDSAPIRLFFGSSSSSNNLSENGADLCGGSNNVTLSDGLSDFISLDSGRAPTNGTVKYVADLAGNGDVTDASAGDTLYIIVDDMDRNNDNSTTQTMTVTLTTPSGDSETITLTETGVNTGKYSGSIPSAYSTTHTSGNGTLQVNGEETVTVTYIDKVDATNAVNVARTDTLAAHIPVLSLAKTVSPTTVSTTDTVTYTITITNSGNGDGRLTSVVDTLPAGFSYVNGTTTGLTTANPTITGGGLTLTWSGTWTVPKKSGGVNGTLTLSFQALTPNSAGDYDNNVTINGSNFTSVSTGNTATVSVKAPSLSLAKTVNPASVVINNNVTYTITITNAGDGVGKLTSVVDTLPAGFSYVNGTTTGLTTANPGIVGQVLTWSGTWTVPKKTGGVDGTLTLSFQALAPGTTGTYYNNVTINGSNFTPVSTGATAQVLVMPIQPLMTLQKLVDKATAPPGAVLTYEIRYHNTGAGLATSLIILDTVPMNTTYVTGSLRMGNGSSTYATATTKSDAVDGDEADVSGGNVTFKVGNVTADNGVAGSGTDEGKVFFQVQIL